MSSGGEKSAGVAVTLPPVKAPTILISAALALILGVPFAMTLGRGADHYPADTPTLVIVTPHVQQIRQEFGRAFSRWHERTHGTPVRVDYRVPGGTSEIRRQLDAMYTAAIQNGSFVIENGAAVMDVGSIGYDLMFGGGSYEHGRLADGVTVATNAIQGRADKGLAPDATLTVSMSQSAGFTQDELDALFGSNVIGSQTLYDAEQRWIGKALSSFGLVYNTDVLGRLGMQTPESFYDLTDPRLVGWVAVADPRMSGSVTTTFDAILGNHGWDEGWRILREMSGNARYFTASSTLPPQDVSQGNCAIGIAIDFYGRGQGQVVEDATGDARVGYVDPVGAVYIDADPITILNGAAHAELARRFLRFVLSEEGQALWQFRAGDPENPPGPDGRPMGPVRYELRRMPARRVMYEKYMSAMVDQVDPFRIASDVANPGWRTGVQVMMGCFAVDLGEQCRRAWGAIAEATLDPSFPGEVLERMSAAYHAWPPTPVDEQGRFTTEEPTEMIPWTEQTYGAVRNSWRPPGAEAAARIYYIRFFRAQYEEVLRLRAAAGRDAGAAP